VALNHIAQSPFEVTGRRLVAGPTDPRPRSPTATDLLAGIERRLAPSLDQDDVVAAVASLAIPELADWSVLELTTAPQTTPRATVVHFDPGKRGLAGELEQLLLSRSSWARAARLGLTGQPEIVDGPVERWLTDQVAGGRLGDVLGGLGAGSALCVPLMTRDTLVGLLTLVSVTPDRYRAGDLALAALVGQRAATAIDHARRFGEVQRETRALTELWAMAAHDLKSAVTAVLLRASLLLVTPESAPKSDLESIERTARHLQRLTVDLLDSARLQSGQLVLARAPQSVDELVSEVLDRFKPLAAARQLCLMAVLEPGLPRLDCDREQLLRVLCNLVDNAVKFTAPGGSVVVRAGSGDGCVQVAVSDTGMGIAESVLGHVFERYWQRDRSGHGTGLGLYIAKEIVSAHGGTIGVESQPGAGTRFFFTIPAPA
jgi:signal transduction histidine kinase